MPYKSRKVRNKNCYKVYKNDKTKKVFAKCATKENAKKQMRLLRAIQNNKNFKPNARRNMGGKSRKNKTLKKKGGRGANTSNGAQFQAPRTLGPPLRSGDYIRITAGQYVNIIDTSSIRANNSVGFQHHRLLSAITGVITSELGRPFNGYYHMVVTIGNSQIQAGTSLYISMQDYDANSHPPLITNPDSEPEEKRDDEHETQVIVR